MGRFDVGRLVVGLLVVVLLNVLLGTDEAFLLILVVLLGALVAGVTLSKA